MKKRSLRQTLLAGCLILAVLLTLVWEFVPLPDAQHRVQHLLENAGTSHVQSLPPTPVEMDILGEALALKRLYQIGHEQFLVIVLDGTKNRQAVHDPQHCFHSGGWQLGPETETPTARGLATELRLKQPTRETEILYWFTDGQTHHPSPITYWMSETVRRLTLGQVGEAQLLILIQKLSPPNTTKWDSLFQAVPALSEI